MSEVKTKLHYTAHEDTLIVERTQDVQAILDDNKRQFNDTPEFGKFGGDMTKVASIPLVVLEKWQKEEGLNYLNKEDWPKIMAKLNDGDYKLLRTYNGKI